MNNEMREAFEERYPVSWNGVVITQLHFEVWQAACKWMQEEQIQRDAEICDKNTKKFPACICAELIRNQEKV